MKWKQAKKLLLNRMAFRKDFKVVIVKYDFIREYDQDNPPLETDLAVLAFGWRLYAGDKACYIEVDGVRHYA